MSKELRGWQREKFPFTVLERKTGTRECEELSGMRAHLSTAREPILPYDRNHPNFIIIPRCYPEWRVEVASGTGVFYHDIIYGPLKRKGKSRHLDWDDLKARLKAARARPKPKRRQRFTVITVKMLAWTFEAVRTFKRDLAPGSSVYCSPHEPECFAIRGNHPWGELKLSFGDDVDFDCTSDWTVRSPEERYGPEVGT